LGFISNLPATCVKQKENGNYDVAIFVPKSFSASGFAHLNCKAFNVSENENGTFSIGAPREGRFLAEVKNEDGKTDYKTKTFDELIKLNNQSKSTLFALSSKSVHERVNSKTGEKFYAVMFPVSKDISDNGFAVAKCPAYSVVDNSVINKSDKVTYVRLAGADNDIKLNVMKNNDCNTITMTIGELQNKVKEARAGYKADRTRERKNSKSIGTPTKVDESYNHNGNSKSADFNLGT